MSDESGGDFGGGSVKWEIRYPTPSSENPVEHNKDVPDHPEKKNSNGRDNRSGLTKFYLVLRNTPAGDETLKDQLTAAVNELGESPRPQAVVITLPIRGNQKQIRVLWEEPHTPYF